MPSITGTVTADAGTNLNTSLLALEAGGNLASIKAKTDNIPALGQALAASSTPVVLTAAQIIALTPPAAIIGFSTETTLGTRLSESDFDTKTGSLTETAPGTDTDSSGLNGRLQRIAQRITSLITALGSPFQAGGSIGNTTFAATQATGTNLHTVVDSGTITTVTAVTSITNTVNTKEVRSATPSQSSTSVTNASTVILASNSNRLGATIFNEGAAISYTKLGGTASITSYTIQIASGGYYECPFGYTGAIDGITSSGTAQLRVTELTT
jgi:hypothetical protein